jgi:IS5 family transposase
MALGALIIKERLAVTDEETVEQIRENPYLQYFIGLHEFQEEEPFDPSMMVHFRKRINLEMIREINEQIIGGTDNAEDERDEDSDNKGNGNGGNNKGQLIIDATCTPADIKYPTDLSLLNESREKAEEIIDTLHEEGSGKKPRTYRKKARKYFLRAAKKKKQNKKEIRKALKKQLQFVNRD